MTLNLADCLEWGKGSDPVLIQLRAFLPLRVTPKDNASLSVTVHYGIVQTSTGDVVVATQDVDLSAYVPALPDYAEWVLITVNDSGAVVATAGTAVTPTTAIVSAGSPANEPTTPADTVLRLALVQMYRRADNTPQTVIYEDPLAPYTDIVDLRLFGNTAGTTITPGSGLPWFNVVDYGAVGDGTTDDTSAVNDAIAALNTATHGVLYFPAGTYKCTAGLTTITAFCTIMGDTEGTATGTPGSVITCTSATAVLFTMNTLKAMFYNVQVRNTSGAASAGSGVAVTHATAAPRVDFRNFKSQSFYDGIDIQEGGSWVMNACGVNALRYGVRIRNGVNPDAGDWTISESTFTPGSNTTGTAGIRIESSGGGKLSHVKVNESGANRYEDGISLATGGATSILLISSCSIENVSGDGIDISTSGSGAWNAITIHGCQFGLYGNSTGNAIKIACGTLGDINGVTIIGNVFFAGSASYAMALTKVNQVIMADNVNYTFGAQYSASGCTNVFNGLTSADGSYTDNAIARWDGTSGIHPQNSLATVDDSGGINIPTGQTYNINGTPHTHALVAEDVQDIIGAMVTGNTESGISTSYDDTNGKLDFAVDPVTAGGAGQVTGIFRWLASTGQTTFDLPDLAESLVLASDNGSIVDPFTYSLSSDRTQLVFDSGITAAHIVLAEFIVAQG